MVIFIHIRKHMTKSGVYKITNEATGKFYIGSSKNIEQRFNEHKMMLNNNKHVNIILQRSWNKHGSETFSFTILEECQPEQCIEREQYYLDLLQPFKSVGYNIGKKAYGGDNFTNNPKLNEIKEKIRLLNLGHNNPMFGKSHSNSTIKKQKERAKGRYTLKWFIERHGDEIGTQKYHERREMLANRKINYAYDNGLKGKKVKVEKTRGKSVSEGRSALKSRKVEFDFDIKNQELSILQLSEKYDVSTTTVKYHRRKLKNQIL